jgi:hypothetical protein
MNRLLTIFFILFCLEIGIFLLVAPWTWLWQDNFLLSYVPVLRSILLNNFLRGAVSGLGAVDITIGMAELARFVKSFKMPRTIE